MKVDGRECSDAIYLISFLTSISITYNNVIPSCCGALFFLCHELVPPQAISFSVSTPCMYILSIYNVMVLLISCHCNKLLSFSKLRCIMVIIGTNPMFIQPCHVKMYNAMYVAFT